MGKPLAVDWKVIEREFLGGKTRGFIASKYGISLNTLDARSRRCKWVAKRNQITEKLAQVRTDTIIQNNVDKQARYLNRIANQVDHSLDVLESEMPGTRKELKDHIEVLEKVDRIARPALGLVSQNQGSQGKTVVNLAILRTEEPTPVQPAIDIP